MLYPKSVEEAIRNLQIFFEADMWYASHNEWKTEKDMLKYLRGHFDILNRDIQRLEKVKDKK